MQNVLLVVFDTARADHFDHGGPSAGSTAAFADLARRGSALPHAVAPSSWTVPSHASMLSGLLPRAAGVPGGSTGRPGARRAALESLRERLLPDVLRRAGYDTRAVSANLWVRPQTGFGTGFERFHTIETRRQERLGSERLAARLRWCLEGMRASADDGAAEAGEMLRGWLEDGRPRSPFFWFVNLVECHSPYLPPAPYNDLGAFDRWRAAAEASRHLHLDAIWRACAGGFDIPPEALERMRYLYRRSIEALDDWLADLLEALDRSGLLEETLVIVTSDHGENLGEGGLIAHALSLDERLLRVPCAVAGPGAFSEPGPFSLSELPLRIAEAVGIGEHPWVEDRAGEGIVVAEVDPPAERGDPRVAAAVSRWGLGPEAEARLTTPLSSASDGRLKLLARGEREELYDLEADPLELDPLPPDPSLPAVVRLREAIASAGAAAGQAGPATGTAQAADSDREDLERRMRLLGYL